MVKNLWKNITLVCGCNHCMETEMKLVQGPSSLFYACPRYYPENREKGEKACANRINLIDYEKMVDHFSEEFENSIMEGCNVDLTNSEWVYKKQIVFRVLGHKNGQLKVSMYNKKAIK